MTAKEYAEFIYLKFYDQITSKNKKREAKRCADIAVTMMIILCSDHPEVKISQKSFWIEIKKEIKKI